jgi:3-dehydroquinate synthase
MTTISVGLGARAYPIQFVEGLVTDGSTEGFAALDAIVGDSVFVVTNETVSELYSEKIQALFGHRRYSTYVMPDGEFHKTMDQVQAIVGRLLEDGCTRDTTIVAVGGGVVGDVAGFAAAIYQRGIAVVQVPTTLLAQVDSSVGGKTAVNHPLGKNMMGAFHQPSMVLIDVTTLRTLSAREYAAGLAEVVKHAALADLEYFVWLEDHVADILDRETSALTTMIAWSCRIKAEIVAEDETERGRRALLNFGHTFGHAIETLSGYGRVLHGEAVAIGMVMAADLSCRLSMVDQEVPDRIAQLLSAFGLPIAPEAGFDSVGFRSAMGRDKKATSEGLRLIVLEALGNAVITADFGETLLRDTLAAHLD